MMKNGTCFLFLFIFFCVHPLPVLLRLLLHSVYIPIRRPFGLNFWTMRKIALNNITTLISLTDSIHIVGHSSSWLPLVHFALVFRPIPLVERGVSSLFFSHTPSHYDEFSPKTFLSLDVFFPSITLLLCFVVLVIYLWFLFLFAFFFKKKEEEKKQTHTHAPKMFLHNNIYIPFILCVFIRFYRRCAFFMIIIRSLEFWPSAHSDHTHKNG